MFMPRSSLKAIKNQGGGERKSSSKVPVGRYHCDVEKAAFCNSIKGSVSFGMGVKPHSKGSMIC